MSSIRDFAQIDLIVNGKEAVAELVNVEVSEYIVIQHIRMAVPFYMDIYGHGQKGGDYDDI